MDLQLRFPSEGGKHVHKAIPKFLAIANAASKVPVVSRPIQKIEIHPSFIVNDKKNNTRSVHALSRGAYLSSTQDDSIS